MEERSANGLVPVAPVALSKMEIGVIVVRNVKAVVGERGRLHTTLLSWSFSVASVGLKCAEGSSFWNNSYATGNDRWTTIEA